MRAWNGNDKATLAEQITQNWIRREGQGENFTFPYVPIYSAPRLHWPLKPLSSSLVVQG